MSEKAIAELVNRLAQIQPNDRLENIYAPQSDPNATTRRRNLVTYLTEAYRRNASVLFLLEAPGYRGCSHTGIPITSERIMLVGIEKFNLFGDEYRPTSGQTNGVAESSATIFWNALVDHVQETPVLWNTVPLHPHKPGNTQSNRPPSTAERRLGYPYIEQILSIFEIKTVIAVGRKAQTALEELNISHTALRHPSQGGKADFIAGLQQVFTVAT